MNGLTQVHFEVAAELERAKRLHPNLSIAHERFAVLKEEVDELWDEVKANTQDKAKMRKEAVQVAAMALLFIENVCDS